MAEQNETSERNVYEDMGDNRQPPNVYENVNSTSTRRVSPLDKGVSRRVLLIGLLVPTLVALGAVCAVVVFAYTQQARLQESVKDLAAQVESLKSTQESHTRTIQNLSDQMASILNGTSQVELLQNITNQDDCQDHSCINNGTCVDGTNSFMCLCPQGYMGDICEFSLVDLTLEGHLRQITANRSLSTSHSPSFAIDKRTGSSWSPGPDYWMAWIKVDFVSTYTVSQVDIMLLCTRVTQPSSYMVTLSDSSTQEFSKECPLTCPRPTSDVPSDKALHTLWLDPRRTSSVQLQPIARCGQESKLYHQVYELIIWGY